MEKRKEVKKGATKAKAVAPKKEAINKGEVSKPVRKEAVAEAPKKVVVKEATIFDKYRKHIDTVKDGYLRDLDYKSAMEILRYIEKNRNVKLGLNMSCASCMVELVAMLARLEG